MGGRRLRRGVFCCILIYSIRKPPTKGLTSHSWGGWSIFLLPGRSRPGLLFSQDTVGPKSLTRENSDVSTFRRTARRVWAQQQERTPPRIVLGHRTHLRSDLQAISDLEVEKSLETCGSGQGRPYTLVGAKRCQRGRCQRGDPSTSLQTAASPVSNETATVYIYICLHTASLCHQGDQGMYHQHNHASSLSSRIIHDDCTSVASVASALQCGSPFSTETQCSRPSSQTPYVLGLLSRAHKSIRAVDSGGG